MQYRPNAKDLLLAVQDLLIKEILPKIGKEESLSYKTLVSWNMLGILIREMEKEEDQYTIEFDSFLKLNEAENLCLEPSIKFKNFPKKKKLEHLSTLNRELARNIRKTKKSDLKSAIWHHIKLVLKNNLSVSNPRFNP